MRETRAPALLAALALHVVVLGAGLITLPFWSKPIELTSAVPITIVSQAPPEPPSAPVQAPEPTPAATPEPAPTPQPAPPPPPPPRPAPAPPPKPAPPPPTPAPAKAPAKPLSLDDLAKSLPQAKAQPNRNAPAPPRPFDMSALAKSLPNSGRRGPPTPQAAPDRRPGPPAALSGDEKGALISKLERLWGLNCGVDDAQVVAFQIRFRLRPDGQLDGRPELLDRPVVEAHGAAAAGLAQRALAAVVRGDPYSDLPKDRYAAWREVTATFDTKKACANSR